MKLKKAIYRAQYLRNLWKMEVHVMNNSNEDDLKFNEDFFCVIDINLYIYVKHEYIKNHKVYYSAQNFFKLLNWI